MRASASRRERLAEPMGPLIRPPLCASRAGGPGGREGPAVRRLPHPIASAGVAATFELGGAQAACFLTIRCSARLTTGMARGHASALDEIQQSPSTLGSRSGVDDVSPA